MLCYPKSTLLSKVSWVEAHNDAVTVLHAWCQATGPNMQATWPMSGTWIYDALNKFKALSVLPVTFYQAVVADILVEACEQPTVSWCVWVAAPACNMNKGCCKNFQT